MHGRRVLAEDLHRDRALPGDDVGIVERVHERQPALLHQLDGVPVAVAVGLPCQHDLGSEGAHRLDLELGRRGGHHDHGVATQPVRREGHPLCMVPGRGRDHATGPLVGVEARHLVVGAADLEREHRLQIFTLEEHGVAETGREVHGRVERCLVDDVVDVRVQDPLQVVGRRVDAGGHSSLHFVPGR